MAKVLKLNAEEVQDRTNWLMNHAGREFWHLVQENFEGDLYLDAAGIDKLREISTVARQVALYFEERNRGNS